MLERYQLSQLQQPNPHGNEFDLYSSRDSNVGSSIGWGSWALLDNDIPDNLQATKSSETLWLSIFSAMDCSPNTRGLYIKETPEGVTTAADIGIEIRSDRAPIGNIVWPSKPPWDGLRHRRWGRITTYRGDGAFATHRPSAQWVCSTSSTAVKGGPCRTSVLLCPAWAPLLR